MVCYTCTRDDKFTAYIVHVFLIWKKNQGEDLSN